MVIYFNKIRRAETRLYSLIEPLTHLKSLFMDSIDGKEPAKDYLLFQEELLEVIKSSATSRSPSGRPPSPCSSRSTTKTKSSRSIVKRCSTEGVNRFLAKDLGNVYFGHNPSMTCIGDYVPPIEWMQRNSKQIAKTKQSVTAGLKMALAGI